MGAFVFFSYLHDFGGSKKENGVVYPTKPCSNYEGPYIGGGPLSFACTWVSTHLLLQGVVEGFVLGRRGRSPLKIGLAQRRVKVPSPFFFFLGGGGGGVLKVLSVPRNGGGVAFFES